MTKMLDLILDLFNISVLPIVTTAVTPGQVHAFPLSQHALAAWCCRSVQHPGLSLINEKYTVLLDNKVPLETSNPDAAACVGGQSLVCRSRL